MGRKVIAISGPRDWPGGSLDVVAAHLYMNSTSLFFLGDCPTGVDEMAARLCRVRGLDHATFYANWPFWGNHAGPRRNGCMIERADELIAFWAGRRGGTTDCIRRAREVGIPILIVTPDADRWALPAGTSTEGLDTCLDAIAKKYSHVQARPKNARALLRTPPPKEEATGGDADDQGERQAGQ